MANKVDAKLTDISNKRTAKVNAIRELETKLRKSGKSLNTELNKLNSERTKLEADYNKFAKVAKTAKEYVKLNDELKKLQSSIAQAEARGESTASYKSSRTGVIQRLNQISSEVESVFPEIKVARAVLTTTLSAKSTGPTGTPTGPTGPTGTPAGKPTGTPADKPTGTPADKPTGTPAGPTGTPAGPTGTPETIVDREAEALNEAAKADFALPETLFKNIPSLAALLKKYVSTPGMTPDAFRKMLRDDVWYKQNSKEIKERFVQYYNFRELQASGRAQGTTDYEMQIAKIEASLKKRAVEIGSAAASDPAALRKAAENLYITNRSEDNSFIDDFLAASIRTISGTIGVRVTEGY